MDGIISDQLIPIELNIEQIYLDPNNPRFVDDNWQTRLDEKIDHEAVQRDTQDKMVKFHDVDKLRINMEINGFLPIDQVIVREFKPNLYVVLEGNRRITAAKQILEMEEKGVDIDEDVLRSIRSINCLLYTGSDVEAAWIFQGLRHITGIKPWSAYNKAKLMNRLLQEEGTNLTEVGKKFGLSPHGAGQWIRGYNAFRQAKDESEFSRETSESAYTYFQELFGRSNLPLREWMQWNESEYRFGDATAFNEFLGWLYPKPHEDEISDDQDPENIEGDWDNRRITTNRGLRDISYLIKNAVPHFEAFRRGEDLTKSVSAARLEEAQEEAEGRKQPAIDLLRNLADLNRDLRNAPIIRFKKDDALREELLERLSLMQDAIGELTGEFADYWLSDSVAEVTEAIPA